MIYTCFCGYYGEPPEDSTPTCPRCGFPTLHPATEWEMFMGMRLTHTEELDVRQRVADILRRERHP